MEQNKALFEQEQNNVSVPDLGLTYGQISISGILPVSSEFANYEKTYPGAAERLLTMAEKEQAHRHAVQMKSLELDKHALELESNKENFSLSASKTEVKLAGQGQISAIIIFLVLTGSMMFAISKEKVVFASVSFVFLVWFAYSVNFVKLPSRKKLKDASERDE